MPALVSFKSESLKKSEKAAEGEMPVDFPVAIVQSESASASTGRTVAKSSVKKYVIIAIAAVVVAGLLTAAVLGGIYIFFEAEKEIVKYTIHMKNNAKQEVTSDPNTNIVQYRVSNPGQEALIINDFNKDIQVVKMTSEFDNNCYVTALNRSNAMDPKSIVTPNTKPNLKASKGLTFVKSSTPITDSSFLCKAAREACEGVSVYWVYPQCSDAQMSAPTNHTETGMKSKRSAGDYSPYYFYWSDYDSNYESIWCVEGCCRTVCACSITYYWVIYYDTIYCVWFTYSCPPSVYSNPVYDYCSDGPYGLDCPNYEPAELPYC